ncbi:MAG: diacylglycerol kinase [Micrococcaceae bacterium]|uniref:Diacylglycerol kinase family lipid kinase n=1 Tax=Arthrobacter cheniae TaxID=1258888 RepID=A0A3A5MBN5_9MICC|nr:diacylglycerol kinase family protein [Arthrobacter cheniae]MCU1634712.1 diacylglycerol kinase [Micrococcaceae bacterium]RJT80122.1 diacylglycerol kinase family lipid kinase [Arthrobacter cheniae]
MRRKLLAGTAAASAAVASLQSYWSVRRLQQTRTPTASVHEPMPVAGGHQRVALVLNPSKLQADITRALVEQACSDAGWEPPLVLETTIGDPGTGQAERALDAGVDVVIAAGGDGTVRAVAQALAHRPAALGLLPLGTGNLLVRNLGLPYNDIAGCLRLALHGYERRIDMARITLRNDSTHTSSEQPFLVMGGVGFDASVVADAKQDLKDKFGWLAYSEAGVRHLPGRRRRISISLDGQPPQSRKVRSLLVANCGKLPAGVDFVPNAMIDDGYLDVVVLSPRSLVGWTWMAAKILLRHSGVIPVISYYRAREVTVWSGDPIDTQLDGDASGSTTSLTARVDPGALMVRVPASAPGPSGSTSDLPSDLQRRWQRLLRRS